MQQTKRSTSSNAIPGRSSPDRPLIAAVLLLAVLGQIMMYSTTFYWSYTKFGNPLSIYLGQLRWFILGLVGFAWLTYFDFGRLRRLAVFVLGAVFISLLLVAFVGSNVFGAQRTLLDGSVQPSEFAKLGMVIYASAWLAGRRTELRTFSEGMLPYGFVIGVIIALILVQPDLSTAFVLSVMMLTMYFMSEASLGQFLLVVIVFLALFWLVVTVNEHSADRLATYLAAVADPLRAEDYHIRQLMLTMGGGGWLGHGIGASYQKFLLLPTPHTDSVVAVLVDEMGFVGLIFFLVLIGVFVWRGMRIAMASRSSFGAYVAVGITVWVGVQTLMNLLSVLAIIPFTGVPAPFLSLGGSSLVSLLLACGLLASVSRGSTIEPAGAAADEPSAPRREPRSVRRIEANGQIATPASHDLRWRNRGARSSGAERAAGAGTKVLVHLERIRRQLRRRAARSAVRRRE